MKTTRLDDDGEKEILHVEADWSELAADYDDIVSAYAHVQIPGFRPGKIPRSVIEQRLQNQILDDLAHRAAHRLGRGALRETAAEPLGPLEIGDIECEKGKPFRFTARFWPMPDIALPDPGSLAAQDDSIDLRDQISHRLLELVHFTVPDDVVRAELGDDDRDAGRDSGAWNAACDRVRLMIILNRLAGQEGIEVSEADVERRIKEKAIEFNTDTDVLRSELEEGGGRQRLKDMLLAESTLDYLVERTTRTKGESA
jgi:FKBP-type peptidyl-prolyl cis-trans isomerase (trigger factor)